MSKSVELSAFFREIGFDNQASQDRAKAVLVEAGKVRAERSSMSEDKKPGCAEILAEKIVRLCRACERDEDDPREKVVVTNKSGCEYCDGSTNKKALDDAGAVMLKNNVKKVVVVGGSPGIHRNLVTLWPKKIELRIVDGTESHNEKASKANLLWADLVIIWQRSELKHRVSKLYTDAESNHKSKVIMVPRRGIGALAERVKTHLCT
ncbi:MAG: hypothetical protein NUW37_08870 [Planctomycetes bacterium]|nr:hypothetical protein [Planctomycetota bacterium]